MKLVRYDAARRALAEATRVDEVKSIRDKAVAMAVYAKQAKDGELIGMATEIRKRAERRLGEVMTEDREAGRLARGARERGTGRGTTRVAEKPASLKDQGIDKNLADRARKAAAMPETKFEAEVAKAVRIAVAATEGTSSVISEARAERHQIKKQQRDKREQKMAAKIVALPKKKFGVIYADPEWKFEVWSEKGLDSASADNHYRTSTLDVIKSRDVKSIAADDCVLFLWATNPMLPQAIEVMEAWGFRYVTNCCWVKHKIGTGYWFRSQHELLLVGRRGKVVAPSQGGQYPSAVNAPAGRHSEKPVAFAEMIERYFPNIPKIELNRRGAPRAGWDAWGDEVEQVRLRA